MVTGDLRHAAGHIPGTAVPGRTGQYGHRRASRHFLSPAAPAAAGDTIVLRTLAGRGRYRVASLRVVRPEDIAVLYPTAAGTT